MILCPAGPGAAPPLDCSRYWVNTSQWNLLDYPALVFPVTTVDPAVDVWDEGYIVMNEQDPHNHVLCKNPSPFYLLCLCDPSAAYRMQIVIQRSIGERQYRYSWWVGGMRMRRLVLCEISYQLGSALMPKQVIEAFEYIQEQIGVPFTK